MDASAHTVGMLLADARLPSGGHAQSAGLEPALLGGLPVDHVPAFLLARARTVSIVDAATAVTARHAALDGLSLAPVERAWAARTPSRALRDASRDLGRGLLRLATQVWPQVPPLLLGVHGVAARPLVLGAIAAHAGVDAAALVRLSIYDDMACAVAALLKLEPGDPAQGVRLVLDACASVEPQVHQLAALTNPDHIPAAAAPHAEAWAEAHALTSRRLFRA